MGKLYSKGIRRIMNGNGVFKKKKGFTIVVNTITRNSNLSLKAKGLFSLISSYITMEELKLTKNFIFNKCMEGEKAFNSTWIELKEKGYLKVYMRPGSENGWIVEYELLDEPRADAHTYYLSKTGQVTMTNITKAKNKNRAKNKDKDKACKASAKEDEIALPQKVGYGERTPQNGSNAKGGNKVNTFNNTFDNTIINQSINLNDYKYQREIEDGENDFSNGIPLSFCESKHKMSRVIKNLSDWEVRMRDKVYAIDKAEYKLFVEALIEMATEKSVMTYKGQKVKARDVISKINECLNEDEMGALDLFVKMTLEDYITGTRVSDVRSYKAYMKSCIWNSFSTFRVRYKSEFKKSYYRALNS